MILDMEYDDIKESQDLFDWLILRGFNQEEAVHVLVDLLLGDKFQIALCKVIKERKKIMEKKDEKYPFPDMGSPITP